MQGESFSVIIPCYNVEKYVREAVDSIINQTYRNFEVILVDDGSTDGTPEICDSYAERYEYVSVIHQENGGLSDARNKGFEKACGKYVYFLDSDDFVDANLLQAAAKWFAEEPGLDMVCFGHHRIDEAGQIISDASDKSCEFGECDCKANTGRWWFETLIKKKCYEACVPFHVYRRSFLLEHKLCFYPKIIHEDELFSFNAYLCAQKMFCDMSKYYFERLRPGSIMTGGNYKAMFDSGMTICGNILGRYDRKEFSKEEMWMFLVFLARIRSPMLSRYRMLTSAERAERKKEYEKMLLKCLKVMIKQRDTAQCKDILLQCYSVHCKI